MSTPRRGRTATMIVSAVLCATMAGFIAALAAAAAAVPGVAVAAAATVAACFGAGTGVWLVAHGSVTALATPVHAARLGELGYTNTARWACDVRGTWAGADGHTSALVGLLIITGDRLVLVDGANATWDLGTGPCYTFYGPLNSTATHDTARGAANVALAAAQLVSGVGSAPVLGETYSLLGILGTHGTAALCLGGNKPPAHSFADIETAPATDPAALRNAAGAAWPAAVWRRNAADGSMALHAH